jgi:hypothetical protein
VPHGHPTIFRFQRMMKVLPENIRTIGPGALRLQRGGPMQSCEYRSAEWVRLQTGTGEML